MEPYGALILAGGQARRLGGVHKPGLLVGGVSLLDRVLAAVPDAATLVVVGPPQPVPPGVRLIGEQPPGGGPVAALAAGLPVVEEHQAQSDAGSLTAVGWLGLLAADLPFLTPAVFGLVRAAASAPATESFDGAVLVDDDGRDQYLAGVYRISALRAALGAAGGPAGVPLRRVVGALRLTRVAAPAGPCAAPPWFDCDDAEDIRLAQALASESSDQPPNRPAAGEEEVGG